MQKMDWRNLSKNYKGLWVALDEKEKSIVSSGKTAKKVYAEAKEKGINVPVLFKVPTSPGLYVGQFR